MTTRAQKEQNDMSRRDIAGVLGSISLGLVALGCGEGSAEATGTSAQSAGLTISNSGTVTCDTMADLRAVTGTSVANVLGYYADGDGGGGQFFYDTTCSLGDDGGQIILPNALHAADGGATGAGRWRRVLPDGSNAPGWIPRPSVLNVRHFGAKLDGTTDDTAAFQRTIAAAAAAQRSATVLVPRGVAILSAQLGPLPLGMTLQGEGTASYTLGEGSILKFTNTTGDGLYAWQENNGNTLATISIRRLSIQATNNVGSGGAAIEFKGGGGFIVSECQIIGWDYAIVLDGANSALIEKCSFDGFAIRGVWCTDGAVRGKGWTIGGGVTNDVSVVDCTFNGPLTCFYSNGGASHYIRENLMNLGASSVNPVWLIDITNDQNVVFEGNYFEGNSMFGHIDGAIKLDGVYGICIRDNFGAVGGPQDVPFIVAHDQTCTVVQIENNVVSMGCTAGLILGARWLTRLRLGPNSLLNAKGGLFDTEGAGYCEVSSGLTATAARPGSMGVNTLIPAATLDVREMGASGDLSSEFATSTRMTSSNWAGLAPSAKLRFSVGRSSHAAEVASVVLGSRTASATYT